jgi:hypothetical protein
MACAELARSKGPPGVEVGLEIHAPGYDVWYYPGYGGFARSMPLKAKSGEKLALNIKLQPLGHWDRVRTLALPQCWLQAGDGH